MTRLIAYVDGFNLYYGVRSNNGEIVSLVVTVPPLSPVDELERQRIEFLDMV